MVKGNIDNFVVHEDDQNIGSLHFKQDQGYSEVVILQEGEYTGEFFQFRINRENLRKLKLLVDEAIRIDEIPFC